MPEFSILARALRSSAAISALVVLLPLSQAAVAAPGTPAVTDTGTYALVADHIDATWTPADPHAEVLEYQYRVTQTSVNGTVVRDWTSVALAHNVSATGLSLQSGQTYYFGVRSRFGSNQYSTTGNSNGIIVDNAAPNVTNINDGGAWTKSPSALSLSWTGTDSPGSGVRGYRYSVGTSAGGMNVKAWTSVGMNTSATIGSLSLTSGTTYYCNIEATDKAGNIRVVSSDGIRSDRVLPTVTVTDDGDVTTNGTSLHATWAGSDALSGISNYTYAIGTSAAPESIVPYTSVGTQTSVTKTGLTLVDGTIYTFRVKATDSAGNMVTQASNGIRTQLAGPIVNAVIDGGNNTTSANTLTANWVVNGANITEYRYAIGKSAGATNVVPWTSVGLNKTITRTGLTLANATSYFFSVRAYDSSGRYGSGGSDGIKVDLVYPTLGAVIDGGAYTSDATRLSFSFSGSDAESGVKEYTYAIGTPENYQGLVPWTSSGLATSVTVTDLHLVEGVSYYVTVYVTDFAGHATTGTSDGIGLDASPPVMAQLADSGGVTTLANELSASWTATDPMGIASYRFAIGKTAGAADVVPWTEAGLNMKVTSTGLTLQPNQSYFVTVTATDVSGRSTTASTDGIRIDNGQPFVVDDVRMGDPQLCYTNPEFSDDSQYVVWGERIQAMNDAGEGILRMWHCEIDQNTGAFIPWDCKGFSGFDSTDLGRAYVGRDSQGAFYLGANEDYQLVMTRITGPDSGVTTVIDSLADPERRAIYPSVLPDSDKIYVYWLKSHGTSVSPEDAQWVELRYIDIDDPTNEIVVEHQNNTEGLVPMDITFPRWAFHEPIIVYGSKGADGFINVYQVDTSQPQLPRVQLTDDWHRKADFYPVGYEGQHYIATGVDGTTESYVYAAPAGGGTYQVVESFTPPAAQTFDDACLAYSHEPFNMDGKLFTAFQVSDCADYTGAFPYFSQPGQIWFTELLDGSDKQWRISSAGTNVKNEPEPVVGRTDAWIFYTAYVSGFDQTDACSEVHRAATPVGLSAP